MTRLFHIFYIQVLIIVSSVAVAGTYDHCVNSLYKMGGMSLKTAQLICVKPITDRTLECQENLFQIALKSPQVSLETCLDNPYSDASYRGDKKMQFFEDIPRGSKKTVCTVTINSKEERETFRKKLPAGQYDFVELLPEIFKNQFVSRDNAWLDRACYEKVRCDILVFSGHFAESFIGSSGFEISMNTLASYRRQGQCDQFFDSIKEVYLFGCNTLSQKNADSRTIGQYKKVLIEDGVAPHTAQRIAARRYTNYDRSAAQQMSDIFSKAQFIAGFPSLGPTGKSVQPFLDRFLSVKNSSTGFNQTLAKVGMIKVNPQSLASSEALNQSLIARSKLGNFAVLKNYVNYYQEILPVPTVDLIESALFSGVISNTQYQGLKAGMKSLWKVLTVESRLYNVCPLILTEYSGWVDNQGECLKNLKWVNQAPKRPM